MKLKIDTSSVVLFVGAVFGVVGGWLAAAMLGQLDIILAPWYCDPSATWMMPLPFIFNKVISSLLGWEIIYGSICVSHTMLFLSGIILGYFMCRVAVLLENKAKDLGGLHG